MLQSSVYFLNNNRDIYIIKFVHNMTFSMILGTTNKCRQENEKQALADDFRCLKQNMQHF